jgi:hypothetical protein
VYILAGLLTPTFVTEIGVFDIGRTLCEDQFLASSLALRDRLNCDVAIGDKCETMFNLKTSQNHLI